MSRRGRRGAPGLGIQVSKALKTVSGIGISKHKTKEKYIKEQKKNGERINPLESPLIHSYSYMENIKQTSLQFLRFARKEGLGAALIKDFQFEDAGRKWFEHRIQQGIKDIRTEAGHLKKLGRAIEKAWGVKAEIVPDDLTKKLKEAGYPTTRSGKIAQQNCYRRFTTDEVVEGLEHVQSQRNGKAQVLEGQARLGFRLQEAVSLRVKHVDLENNVIYVCEGQKGTRTRFVPIPKDYRQALKNLVSGKDSLDRVYNVQGSNLKSKMRSSQRAWQNACKAMNIKETRTHNLRAYYACERLNEIKSTLKKYEDAGVFNREKIYKKENFWHGVEKKKAEEKFTMLTEKCKKVRNVETAEEREKRLDIEARHVLIEEMGHSDISKLEHYIRE